MLAKIPDLSMVILSGKNVVGGWDERRNMREEKGICRHHLTHCARQELVA